MVLFVNANSKSQVLFAYGQDYASVKWSASGGHLQLGISMIISPGMHMSMEHSIFMAWER